jgi:hypothetical protein
MFNGLPKEKKVGEAKIKIYSYRRFSGVTLEG